MKALSIRQPWAWAILHAGKDIENRDWRPSNPGLKFRGRFLIHASGEMTQREYFDFYALHKSIRPLNNIPAMAGLPRGGVVGIAEIIDVVVASASPWFYGPIGLVIRNARPLPFLPLKGMLGFFEVADSQASAVPFQ